MKQRSEPYPAWADAQLALKYIDKGKARGCRRSLWVRGESQSLLGHVGRWARSHGGLVIFVGLVLSVIPIFFGIKMVQLNTTLDALWTPDSGRLHQELTYVSRVSGLSTDTNEMLIQTPKANSHQSMLHSRALLEHLEVLQRALGVTIDMFDVSWSLKDICYSANMQQLDVQFIDQIFEKVFPCIIITPLDCFWEGSKLLGPSFPITIPGFPGPMKWTNLNPQELLRRARLVPETNMQSFPFEILEGFMKRAGIGSGYQEKPCLNPLDPDCPVSAPNKGSTTPPDIASILAGGCYGFASRFMHWAPDLIIGGPVHNKSGHVTKAGGLMSTVQLMSSSELFDFGRDTWRLKHVEWSESKAQEVLTSWQTRFASEVSHLSMDEDRSSQFNFYTFTAAGLDSVVESASQFSWTVSGARVLGVIGATVLVGIFLSGDVRDWKILLGLLLGATSISVLGTTAGCGIAGTIGIPFNVASGTGFGFAVTVLQLQILPYLTLSLVSPVFFIILHSQMKSGCDAKTTLKRHGFSLILGVVSVVVFIGAGAMFPIPAVRSMALQGAIFMAMGSLAVLVMFPAVCQIVLKKRKIKSGSVKTSVKYAGNICESSANPNSNPQTVPFLHKPSPVVKNNNVALNNSINTSNGCGTNVESKYWSKGEKFKSDVNLHEEKCNINHDGGESGGERKAPKRCSWVYYYRILLNWKWFTAIVVVLYLVWVTFSILGILRLRLGLPITDVVPSQSSEWEFLTAQGKLFPVYHMKAVTKANFDYPNNQKLLVKFHETMSSLPWVIRDDNGAVPLMWLSVFKDWLERLQLVFDREWKLGYLHKEGWTEKATADGILAFKLAVQTGHIDHPVDMTQLPGNRLIDIEGNVNARAFYVYLTAWAWNDPLAFGATAANLKPEPRTWIHSPEDKELKIPKSAPIKYAEISYLLRTTRDDNDEQDKERQILAFVQEVRKISSAYEARGLPVFPWGIPFRFYEQYLNLQWNSAGAVGLAGGITVLILFCCLGCVVRPVSVVIIVAAVTLAQIAGAVGWLGVGLNALPVEISLLGVSLAIFSAIQHVVAFCCIPGSVVVRRSVTFTLVGPPCVQSLVLISLVALILYSPNFTFIFTHFTLLISISALIALLNTILLVPVLLSLIQPTCWLLGDSVDDPGFLHPLTPSPVLKRHTSSSKTHRNSSRNGSNKTSRGYQPPYPARNSTSRNNYYSGSGRGGAGSRAPSENSLSTITEEPSSCATRRSAEIIVQPQVVVETFDGENTSKTKVSAKLKVEVHSSTHGNVMSQSNHTNTSTNMTENSGTSASTSSSGSFTSSSASSSASTSSYNERVCDD